MALHTQLLQVITLKVHCRAFLHIISLISFCVPFPGKSCYYSSLWKSVVNILYLKELVTST